MNQLYATVRGVRTVRECMECTDCTTLYGTVYPVQFSPLTIPLKKTTPRVTGVLVAFDNNRTSFFERGVLN
jgi:hypothetical protein